MYEEIEAWEYEVYRVAINMKYTLNNANQNITDTAINKLALAACINYLYTKRFLCK